MKNCRVQVPLHQNARGIKTFFLIFLAMNTSTYYKVQFVYIVSKQTLT